MLSDERLIERDDVFLCGVLGVAGTAGIVHCGLREEVYVLFLYAGQ